MEKTVAEMSSVEFEHLVERAVDRRLEVWLTQLMDALLGSEEGEGVELKAEFATALRQSVEQAKVGQVKSLKDFRAQIGR